MTRTLRQHHPDELRPEQRERSCPSCRIKWRIPGSPRELYGPLYIDRKAYRWLENAARVFVEQSGDDVWTAEDFVAWIKSDVFGERPPIVEHDGAPPRFDNGGVAKRQDTAHRHPDPIPFAGWRPGQREGVE